MGQTSEEEVKIPLRPLGYPKAWGMATADLARTRFGSLEATAPANLVHPQGETAPKIAARLLEKADLTMHRATKKWAHRSANRSIARRVESAVALDHEGTATSA